MQVQCARKLISWFVALMVFAGSAFSQGVANNSSKQCRSVGGTFMTNLAVIDANTTLGIGTGDLKGAAAATILNIVQNPDGTSRSPYNTTL